MAKGGVHDNMEEGLKRCLENRLKFVCSSSAAGFSKSYDNILPRLSGRELSDTKNKEHFTQPSVSSEEHQKTLVDLARVQGDYATLHREHVELMNSMQVCTCDGVVVCACYMCGW